MKNIVILGATSAIAQETAKCFAQDQAALFLVARNKAKLEAVAADLIVRGASRVEQYPLDLNRIEAHHDMIRTALANLHELDAVLIAHGTLSHQPSCEASVEETLREFTTNCLSVVSLLTLLANYFEQRGTGCLAVISSVAGDRGRQSNYVYGAAKGAVSLFLQGLRNRLAKSGVAVVTIKPGFVDTPMTAQLPKNALFARPETVGRQIYHAMTRPRDVVYCPWFWRPIMSLLCHIPEGLFKRLSL